MGLCRGCKNSGKGYIYIIWEEGNGQWISTDTDTALLFIASACDRQKELMDGSTIIHYSLLHWFESTATACVCVCLGQRAAVLIDKEILIISLSISLSNPRAFSISLLLPSPIPKPPFFFFFFPEKIDTDTSK